MQLLGLEQVKQKQIEEKLNMKQEDKEKQTACECNGEVYAAIAMALHEALGYVHDQEKQILTIRRTNSPWSSKWAALRVIPQRK